jgi:hypothetical protein
VCASKRRAPRNDKKIEESYRKVGRRKKLFFDAKKPLKTLHFAWDVYGFLENRAFFKDPFAVEKIMNFGANGGPRARPRSAPEAP